MTRKLLTGLLALTSLAGGCVSMPSTYSPDRANKAEEVSKLVTSKSDNPSITYARVNMPTGQVRYEALFTKEDRLYLVGVIDEDGDGDRDTLFIYAKQPSPDAKPVQSKDLERIAAKTKGKTLFELTDVGIDGACEHARQVSVDLINIKSRQGMHQEVQKLYHKELGNVLEFYAKSKIKK